MIEPLLVRAARREPVERTPVWFMRQAGRSLPEYRELRKQLRPVRDRRAARGLRRGDAAAGAPPRRRRRGDVQRHHVPRPRRWAIEVELVEGVGPVVREPVRSAADVERLRVPDPEESMAPMLEAVRLVREALRPDQAVVGFCGGPFTVAGYLVEGKPSREFPTLKALMYREPATWARADGQARRTRSPPTCRRRCAHGADVIQLFDSWVGALSPADYDEFVAPWSRADPRRRRRADDPLRHRHGDAARPDGRRRRRRDRPRLADPARPRLGAGRRGPRRPGQPRPGPAARPVGAGRGAAPTTCSRRAAGRPGHIFNLGHGVLPGTDPDVLTRLAAHVRSTAV